MDNKYGLGSRKVATEHQQQHAHKHATHVPLACKFCQSTQLRLCPTMHDHQCNDCGEWQMDVPKGYAVGRSSEY
jgi:hypothetical protein